MVKQLGLPMFLVTLSCTGLRWNKLIAILRGEALTDNIINEMDFFGQCSFLYLNPVLLARRFQYGVDVFFSVIVLNGPLTKVKYPD